MYKIEKRDDSLLVCFNGDFDYSTIKQVIYKELMLPEFAQLNDIWHVGKHRAHLRLGEIQTIVDDFSKLCPDTACMKKTAIVVEPGLTSAILGLLADGLDRKLPLTCRIFESMEAAEAWTGIKRQVA